MTKADFLLLSKKPEKITTCVHIMNSKDKHKINEFDFLTLNLTRINKRIIRGFVVAFAEIQTISSHITRSKT